MNFDDIYYRFKKFCTEWDKTDEEVIYYTTTKKDKSYFTIEELCRSRVA